MTDFGDRDCKRGPLVKMRLLRWALIQSHWCLYQKKRLGHTEDTGDGLAQRDNKEKRQGRKTVAAC